MLLRMPDILVDALGVAGAEAPSPLLLKNADIRLSRFEPLGEFGGEANLATASLSLLLKRLDILLSGGGFFAALRGGDQGRDHLQRAAAGRGERVVGAEGAGIVELKTLLLLVF